MISPTFDDSVAMLVRLSSELDHAAIDKEAKDPFKDIYVRTVVDAAGHETLSVRNEGGNLFTRFFNWCNRLWNREYYQLVTDKPYYKTKTAQCLDALNEAILLNGAQERLLEGAIEKLRKSQPTLIGEATNQQMVNKIEACAQTLNQLLIRVDEHKQRKHPDEKISIYIKNLLLPEWQKVPAMARENLQSRCLALLHKAIQTNDVEAFDRVKGLIDLRDKFRNFVNDCLPNRPAFLKKLVQAGADPNYCTPGTPSMLSLCLLHNPEGLRELLECGVDPLSKTSGAYDLLQIVYDIDPTICLKPFLELDKRVYKEAKVGGAPLLEYLFCKLLEREQIVDYLLDQNINFSWSGLDPLDAIASTKGVLNAQLRTKLNAHIVHLDEQGKREELFSLLQKYGITVAHDCDFSNISQLRPVLAQLVEKMVKEMLQEPEAKVKELVKNNKSREEVKAFLDSVTLTFEGYAEVQKKVVLTKHTLAKIGDFFPKQPPDPTRHIEETRRQAFAKTFLTEKGDFTKEGITLFLLRNDLIKSF